MSSLMASMNSSFSAICSRVFRMLLTTSRFGKPALSARNCFRFSCSVAFFRMPFSCKILKKSSLFKISSVCYLVFDLTFCWYMTSLKNSAVVRLFSKRNNINITIIFTDFWSSRDRSSCFSYFLLFFDFVVFESGSSELLWEGSSS